MAVYLFHGEDRFARLEAVAALRREHDPAPRETRQQVDSV